MAKLRITYTKSAIGYNIDQKSTIRALGLHKLNSTVIHDDTPVIRGMAFKVRHLVGVEEVAETEPIKAPRTPRAHSVRATLAPAAEPAPSEPVAEPAAADDLALIEGIGPKIAGVLTAAGITTFAQLASTDVARLTEILQEANLRLANAESWPEQAALAAAGKWDEFQALTEQLKGGRHV
jgi:large subunit ribosomal protein L17